MDGQAVDIASQKRCVVLFASEDKKRQAKLLPGMTKAGEMGLCVLMVSASLPRGLSSTIQRPASLSAYPPRGLPPSPPP